MTAPRTSTKRRAVHCSKHAFAPISSFRPKNSVSSSITLPAQRHQSGLGRAGLASESAFTEDDPVNQTDPLGLCSDTAIETASRRNRIKFCTQQDGGENAFKFRDGTVVVRQNPATGTINVQLFTSDFLNEVLDNDYEVAGYISTSTGQNSEYQPHGRQVYHTTIRRVPSGAIVTIQFFGYGPLGGFHIGISCLTVTFGSLQ